MSIELIPEEYSWKTLTLSEYLNEGNIPSTYRDFFMNPEIASIVSQISDDLRERQVAKRSLVIYPEINQVFRALYMTKLSDIKAAILGQDPYHNGSAVGLCFSVKPGNTINPSLRSIYKELKDEGFTPKEDGNLIHWAKQGILMLNTSLTVEQGDAGCHELVWDVFTRKLIEYIDNQRRSEITWILMGAHAITAGLAVKHGKIIRTSHPMPLAAGKPCKNGTAFFGSGIFKKIPGVKW